MPAKQIKFVRTTNDKAHGRNAISVDGVRFVKGEVTEVENSDLAKELLSGSDRLVGYQFEEHKEPKDAPEQKSGSGD